jgi:MFS family permease
MQKKIKEIFGKFKKSETGIWVLIAAVSVEWLGWSFSDPFLSIFFEKILGSIFLVGVLVAARNILALFVAIFVGERVENFSTRSLILWEKTVFLLQILLFFLAGIYHSPVLLFAAMFAGAFARPVRDIATNSFLIFHAPRKNSSRIFGILVAARNLFWISGAILSGFFLQSIAQNLGKNFDEVLFFSFLPAIPALIFGFFLLHFLPMEKSVPRKTHRF